MPFDPTAARAGTVFSDVPNYAGAWVCYVNGIEVPIIGFETECGVWQIPSFRIHCIPDPLLQRIGTEDRVPVQIFYLDEWASETPTFRLLIDGEIVGWSFSSATGSRSIAFSCLSHIQVFQQLYFFYMTNVDDIVASRSPEVLAQGFTTPGLLYPHAIFHQGLLTTAAQAQDITPVEDQENRGRFTLGNTNTTTAASPATSTASPDGIDPTAPIQCPYELVTNVVRGVISSEVPTDRRAVPMMNFFARYIRKTRFHNRWVRLPLFEDADKLGEEKGVFPIFRAARNDEALAAMQRQVVAQVGNSGPVWNLFQQVLGLVYMEIAMIPNPACVQVKLTPAGPNKPEEGRILRGVSDTTTLVTERRGLSSDVLQRRANLLAQQLGDYYPESSQDTGSTDGAQGRSQADLNALVRDAGFTTLPTARPSAEQIYQNLYRTSQTTLANQGIRDSTHVEGAEPMRLAQYFVKPQFLFGEVPSCNVIMPSMIDSWGYDESYINQPTRVYVNDSVMTRALRAQGANREFMLHALTVGWPEEANALMRHRVGTSESEPDSNAAGGGAAHGSESGRNLLVWPEEFYKGPVTARAALPSWFQMLRQFANSQSETGEKDKAPPNAQTPNAAPNTPDPLKPGSSTPQTGTSSTSASTPAAAASTPVNSVGPLASGLVSTPNQSTPNQSVSSVNNATQPAANASQADTGPAPVQIPVSTTYGTDTPDTRRRGNRPSAAIMALPAYAVPIRSRPESTQLSISGVAQERFWVARGSGLDPSAFLEPVYTALWPISDRDIARVRRQQNRERRNRQVRQPVEDDNTKRAKHFGQVVNLFLPLVQNAYGALSEEQQRIIAFGFAWLSYTETGFSSVFSWNFGNIKQYYNYPRASWTVNPYDRQPYIAGRTAEEGARSFFNHVREPLYAPAVEALVTGVVPERLQTHLQRRQRLDNPFWQDKSPSRPDLFYITLGFIGYYSTENVPDQLNRADLGATRLQGMQRIYTRMQQLFTQDAIPENGSYTRAIPAADARPLIAPQHQALIATFRGPNRPPYRPGNVAAAQPGTEASNAAEAAEGDTFAKLFELYAQYEYLKQRYAQRNAGANLRFNPYLVPGFPTMLFDSMRTRMHCVGYIQSITHNGMVAGGSSNLSTTVRMSFCRTIYEFINDVRVDAARFEGRVTSAPAEVIDEIRAIIQDETQAEDFYQRLFYGGRPPRGTPACFRWERVMNYSSGIRGEEIYIEGETQSVLVEQEQAERRARQARANGDDPAPARDTPNPAATGSSFVNDLASGTAVSATLNAGNTVRPTTTTTTTTPRATPENNLNGNRELSPRLNTQYANAFDNYDVAMKLASRPVCTLEQFIRFWHGGRTVNDLIGSREVADPRTDFAYAVRRLKDIVQQNSDGTATRAGVTRANAVYYGRIFKLRTGPGPEPGEPERGYTSGPDIQPSATNAGVASTYPETRADWDSALIAYRDRVRLLLSPST